MKLTSDQIKQIAESIANKREDLFSSSSYDRITDYIWDAWKNWDIKILSTYYEGDEKPDEPTWDFKFQHVTTELEQVPENREDLINSFNS